jgi:hypothetical protein
MRSVVKLPVGHLHFDDLGRTVKLSQNGSHLEGSLVSATHSLRRDGSPETILEVRGTKGPMSSAWPSNTICELVLAEPVADEGTPDVPMSPDRVLGLLRLDAFLELAARRG